MKQKPQECLGGKKECKYGQTKVRRERVKKLMMTETTENKREKNPIAANDKQQKE